MASRNKDLKAPRNLISEAHDLLRTANLPDGRSERSEELLNAALHLADTLLETSPAAVLGAKGGEQTAKRGSEYFRQIAAQLQCKYFFAPVRKYSHIRLSLYAGKSGFCEHEVE